MISNVFLRCNLKAGLGVLTISMPLLSTAGLADPVGLKPQVVQQKIIFGDEISDSLTTSSVAPSVDLSCKAAKLDITQRGSRFDMSFAFSSPVSSAQEPSP